MADTYILCQVDAITCALPSSAVQYLELVPPISPLPNVQPAVEGVAIVRGEVVTLLSLRRRLGLPWQPHTLRSRLVVVQAGERRVGLLVDSARDFVRVAPETIEPLTERVGGISPAFFSGVFPRDGRPALVLRLEAAIGAGATPAHHDAGAE